MSTCGASSTINTQIAQCALCNSNTRYPALPPSDTNKRITAYRRTLAHISRRRSYSSRDMPIGASSNIERQRRRGRARRQPIYPPIADRTSGNQAAKAIPNAVSLTRPSVHGAVAGCCERDVNEGLSEPLMPGAPGQSPAAGSNSAKPRSLPLGLATCVNFRTCPLSWPARLQIHATGGMDG